MFAKLYFLIGITCVSVSSVHVHNFHELVSAIEADETNILIAANITMQGTIEIHDRMDVMIDSAEGAFFLERPGPAGGLEGWLSTLRQEIDRRRKLSAQLRPNVSDATDWTEKWVQSSKLLNDYSNAAVQFDGAVNSVLYDWLLMNFESINTETGFTLWNENNEPDTFSLLAMQMNEDNSILDAEYTASWDSFLIPVDNDEEANRVTNSETTSISEFRESYSDDTADIYYYEDVVAHDDSSSELEKVDMNPPFFLVSGGTLRLRNVRMSGKRWTNVALPGLLSGLGPQDVIEDGTAPFLVVTSGGSVSLEKVEFADGLGRGASVAEIHDSSKLNATQSIFRGNWGARGAISVMSGSSMFTRNCIFRRNVALWNGSGGAISIDEGSTLDIVGTTRFQDNTASVGGAIFVGHDSVLKATNASFTGNLAASGGAIDIFDGSAATFVRSKFFKNEAVRLADGSMFGRGGAICVTDKSSLLVDDSTFRYNTVSAGTGAAIYAADDSVVYLASSALEYNTAFLSAEEEESFPSLRITGGGGLFLGTLSTFVLREAKLRYNTPDDIDTSSDMTALLRGTIDADTAEILHVTSAINELPDVDLGYFTADQKENSVSAEPPSKVAEDTGTFAHDGSNTNFVANDAFVAEDLYKAGVRKVRKKFVANDAFVAEDLYKAHVRKDAQTTDSILTGRPTSIGLHSPTLIGTSSQYESQGHGNRSHVLPMFLILTWILLGLSLIWIVTAAVQVCRIDLPGPLRRVIRHREDVITNPIENPNLSISHVVVHEKLLVV